MSRNAAIVLIATCSVAAEYTPGDGDRGGLDVIQAAKTVGGWLGDQKEADPAKPWSQALADLTGEDEGRAARAIRTLVTEGGRQPSRVIDDLRVLATDGNWVVRARICRVLAGIGGEPSATLSITLSTDRERRVRELAVLALPACAGSTVLPRLIELLAAPEASLRQSAAAGIGAFGDPTAIEPLARRDAERDDLVRRELLRSLALLSSQFPGSTQAGNVLTTLPLASRDLLLEALIGSADRRLSPILASIATNPDLGSATARSNEASEWSRLLAVRCLATAGDHRAVEVLVSIADSTKDMDVRRLAAEALRRITGYDAAPGKAWRVWLDDQRDRFPRLLERDAFIAELEPTRAPTAAAMLTFTVDELSPLVDAILGEPADRLASWWPAAALVALRADDPARWTPALAAQVNRLPTQQTSDRIGLILLIDDLGTDLAVNDLKAIIVDLKQRLEQEAERAKELQAKAPDHGPEITLLRQALARRGVSADLN